MIVEKPHFVSRSHSSDAKTAANLILPIHSMFKMKDHVSLYSCNAVLISTEFPETPSFCQELVLEQ
jgi:hypothetical protein